MLSGYIPTPSCQIIQITALKWSTGTKKVLEINVLWRFNVEFVSLPPSVIITAG
jgi:hypothetical protein